MIKPMSRPESLEAIGGITTRRSQKKTGASKVTALLVLSHDAPPCFFSNRNRDPANCPVISKQVRPPGQWHQAPVDLSSRSVAFPARKVNLTQSVTADANKERQSP
jgi:hypothetical protein